MPKKLKLHLEPPDIPVANDEDNAKTRVVTLSRLLILGEIFRKRELDINDLPVGEKTRIYERFGVEPKVGRRLLTIYQDYLKIVKEYDETGNLITVSDDKHNDIVAKQLWFLHYHQVKDIPLDKRAPYGSLRFVQEQTGWSDIQLVDYRKLMLELYEYMKGMEKVDY